MDSSTLAHRGEHAGEQTIDWQPEQVQSGPEGSPPGIVSRGLGVLGLGLGIAQVVAPERVARLVGAPVSSSSTLVTRLLGATQVGSSLGLLGRSGIRSRTEEASPAAPTSSPSMPAALVPTRPMRVTAATTIQRSAADIYRYWRNFENLPDIMGHLKSVELLDEDRSRWTVRAPLGSSASWEAQVVEDVPDQLVAWESVEGSAIVNAGRVRLAPAPGGRGTELHVLLRYEAPSGAIGAALAKLFGDDPVQQVKDDLRRFKQVMETGQVVRSDGAPSGTDARMQPKQRPARPLDD